MADAGLERLAAWLKQQIGLDAASIGLGVIDSAVRARMTSCGSAGLDQYWALLQASQHERQQLIEAVVVPETWFFRDAPAFQAAVRHARALLTKQPHRAPVRLLSLPCSSGEEPYSLAMALLQAGLSPEQFRVDAVDISERALELARRGLYQHHSFRGAEPGLRERFFSVDTTGCRLHEVVRRPVRFHQGNLFAPELLAGEARGSYDIVFCRNVLIYFDRPTQQRAIGVLNDWLAEDGLLVVGPAEAALLLRQQFRLAESGISCTFHKASATEPPKPVVLSARTTILPQPAQRPAPLPVRRPLRPAPRPIAAPLAAGPAPLAAAQQAADKGRFAEALALCEQHNKLHGPSAAAFYLMALVADASGQPQAAQDYYRKTLYLEPTHREALLQLASLLELAGNAAGAQRLYQRAQRGRDE
ncbi:protein-glutamate O-methyltransferase CheR [Crenobacter sp. SG2303]|uniref:Protein-glutamate O-methyltransferase CheR n=1 Tax=Crenobacter oryzisoli TaxID=3056844 RepID=A0ABT7XT76_9NEIS|nr:protein-glutamate O-methyltransferase CheR [Crenobacter sp. SG2303]MDN0076987.1 protein-glutamate O-methyltransferase CheR [Crenobacter sp. SG2303]